MADEKEEVLTPDDEFVRSHYLAMGEEFEYIHAIDAMQRIHPYELLNSIDFVEDYRYIIPSFEMTEIRSREHYQFTFFLDPEDPEKNYHMDVTAETPEEGRIYRRIMKNPSDGLWIFIQTGLPGEDNLNYESIMIYESGPEIEMAKKFSEALLNHYFNYKKYRTFAEVNVAVNDYRTFANKRAEMNPFENLLKPDKK